MESGQDDGRIGTCGTNLTEIMSQRYLDLNPDLQHSLGRGSGVAR
jgi:hypothetical protein